MSLILAFLAQVTPVQPMPKGTGLPPPGTDEGAVMAPINAMLAGLAARDSAAILAQLRPDGGATVANEAPNGVRTVRHMNWTEFAASVKPGPEKYEERISNPAIEIDGDIAMVWTPYTFFIDGKAHHCGVDHFDLVRDTGSWKIVNITWSARATGCEG
ncbi:nuclear transport factor 2 family protein [Sphingomonas sp. QA11]|uniref:nuclear transport factor 2 family protein n=1 Tax=Sphingomonas sp. QA11 TaxID=2950605 RepID=UPI00234B27EF|nr:nuclear transport factor 2 family protein [Sphingomonas sp. QA11]WCM25137.1 nuclear transport factor 2 family protein [Sphingomonas sp. QA11]